MNRRILVAVGSVFSFALPCVASAAPADDVARERDAPRVLASTPGPMAVSFGYENGIWGGAFVQGLRVKIPVHPNWGLAARPLMMHSLSGAEYRADLGGRLELYGASPVFLNFARIYGGGGAQVFQAVSGLPGSKPTTGGGGHFGFEFFFTPKSSFFLEVGGTSGAAGGVGTGGTALAGVTWYPFAETASTRRTATLGL